jgi:hypothetical protein
VRVRLARDLLGRRQQGLDGAEADENDDTDDDRGEEA